MITIDRNAQASAVTPARRTRFTAQSPARVPGPAGERQPETVRGNRTRAALPPRAGHPVQRHSHRRLPERLRPPGLFHRAGQCGGPASADARRAAAADQRRPGPRQRLRGTRRTGRGAATLRHPREPDRRGAQDQPAPESQPLRRRGAPWPTCRPSCRPTCAGSKSRCARSPSRRVSSTKPDGVAPDGLIPPTRSRVPSFDLKTVPNWRM